jgi:hypothetical protein
VSDRLRVLISNVFIHLFVCGTRGAINNILDCTDPNDRVIIGMDSTGYGLIPDYYDVIRLENRGRPQRTLSEYSFTLEPDLLSNCIQNGDSCFVFFFLKLGTDNSCLTFEPEIGSILIEVPCCFTQTLQVFPEVLP